MFFNKSEKEDCFLTSCFILSLSIKFDKLMFTSLYILRVFLKIQFWF